MAGITWLHLSDWHQKDHEDEQSNIVDRKKVLEKLIEDIKNRKNISNKLSHIDFIVFSGDLAFSGKTEEYTLAKKTLFEQVLQATDLDSDKLFIVPGNHDLYRGTFKDDIDYPERLAKSFGTHQEFQTENHIKEVLSILYKRELLLKPFSNFINFVQEYNNQIQPGYASYKILNNIKGKKVGLLGLNSSLISGRKINPNDPNEKIKEQGKLFIGEDQFDSGLKEIKDCDIKIAIMHHPVNWLNDELEFESKIDQSLRKFDFVLCGHRHKSNAVQVDSLAGQYLTINAGASYSSRKYSNGYNFVHFDPANQTGIVYLRLWNNDLGKWINEPYLDEQDNVVYTGSYKFPPAKPDYSSSSSTRLTPIGEEKYVQQRKHKERVDKHYQELIDAIQTGTVVPILGADINLCDRDPKHPSYPWEWNVDGDYPPTNLEIATHIESELSRFDIIRCPFHDYSTSQSNDLPPDCPLRQKHVARLNLPYISQYFWSKIQQGNNKGLLGRAIDNIYKHHKYQTNSVHKFLATKFIKKHRSQKAAGVFEPTRYPLIVTTCFDRTLEQAFSDAQQPYILFSYMDKEKEFISNKYDLTKNQKGEPIVNLSRERPKQNDYLDKYPVIMRLYGPINYDSTKEGENFAITENHFLDFLYALISGKATIPNQILTCLANSNLWFLGYDLSYWNFRIILHCIINETTSKDASLKYWAIQEKPQHLERELWEFYETDLFSNLSIYSLEKYIDKITTKLQ